jgi:hypothetical protein
VADLVRRQVVLEPVAQSLSLDDWRRLQRQVRSRVGASPLFVDVTATAATSASAERLAEAVAERVVQLHAVESGPEPDLAFADRELDRLGAEIARTQAGIDRLLQQMDTAGPAAAGPLGRQLSVLRRKLDMLEATSSAMRGWRSEAGRTPGVRVEDEAYAERGSWPPQPALMALLGAAGGLCALAALGLLTRLRRSERLADGGFAEEEEHAVPAARPVRVAAPVTRVGSRRWPSKS